MRYHPLLKALALMLAALALTAMVCGGVVIFCMAKLELYSGTVEDARIRAEEQIADTIATKVAKRYASEQLSDIPQHLQELYCDIPTDEEISQWAGVMQGAWCYTLQNGAGEIMEQTGSGMEAVRTYRKKLNVQYFLLSQESGQGDVYYDPETGETVRFQVALSETYEVTVRFATDAVTELCGISLPMWERLYAHRFDPVYTLAAALLIFLAALTYLCCAAGRKGRQEIRAGGLNRLPVELWALAAGLIEYLALHLVIGLLPSSKVFNFGTMPIGVFLDTSVLRLVLCVAAIFLGALTGMGFLFALVAQGKTPGRYLWHNSLTYRLLAHPLGIALKIVVRAFRMLPLVWQWLLPGLGLLILTLIAVGGYAGELLGLCVLLWIGLIFYGAYGFGVLAKGTRALARGNLKTQVEEKYLVGCFRASAKDLNALARVAEEAAEAKLRSERMKTDLITNVSHDIKTPLTSIVSYVDLLKTAPDEETRQEYMQVIDRQSLRLKKLIEDMIELSKATSGSIRPELQTMDGGEALKQALGEFTDKFQKSALELQASIPEEPVLIRADGRLLWRVLSNLLSNTVKYAQPGTRVYVQLALTEDSAQICVKNTSRERLNISAQELMERFVRGDTSRNTDGSGLGLSIASSLMEAMGGRLELSIDADLFKAAVTFPLSK